MKKKPKTKPKPKHSVARRKSWDDYYRHRNEGVRCFKTYTTPHLMRRILREVVEPSYLPQKEDGDHTFDELQQALDAYMQEEWFGARSDMLKELDAKKAREAQQRRARQRSGDSILMPSVRWAATCTLTANASVLRSPTSRNADLQTRLDSAAWNACPSYPLSLPA